MTGERSRREYVMSDEQLTRLLDACRPVPYLVMGGVGPNSPQENANAAWQTLGRELGFDWKTVQASPTGDRHYFTAIPSDRAVEPEPEVALTAEACGSWRVFAYIEGNEADVRLCTRVSGPCPMKGSDLSKRGIPLPCEAEERP